MGKLKEVFSEIMEDFNWESFIFGLCVALAIAAFFFGIALAMVFNNLAYLLLWFVSIVAVALAMGVEG